MNDEIKDFGKYLVFEFATMPGKSPEGSIADALMSQRSALDYRTWATEDLVVGDFSYRADMDKCSACLAWAIHAAGGAPPGAPSIFGHGGNILRAQGWAEAERIEGFREIDPAA